MLLITQHGSPSSPSAQQGAEVSILETLLRTVVLVGLTLALAAIFRFWEPAVKLSQKTAATHAWQSLYSVFHIETALGREQLILVGIILFCFTVALVVQVAGLFALKMIRNRS